MPTTQKQLTTTNDGNQTSVTAVIEKGVLTSVSITVGTAAVESAKCYVRIGIQRLDGISGPVVSTLAQGWTGRLATVNWHGRMPMEANYRVFVLAWSFQTVDLTMSITNQLDRPFKRATDE